MANTPIFHKLYLRFFSFHSIQILTFELAFFTSIIVNLVTNWVYNGYILIALFLLSAGVLCLISLIEYVIKIRWKIEQEPNNKKEPPEKVLERYLSLTKNDHEYIDFKKIEYKKTVIISFITLILGPTFTVLGFYEKNTSSAVNKHVPDLISNTQNIVQQNEQINLNLLGINKALKLINDDLFLLNKQNNTVPKVGLPYYLPNQRPPFESWYYLYDEAIRN